MSNALKYDNSKGGIFLEPDYFLEKLHPFGYMLSNGQPLPNTTLDQTGLLQFNRWANFNTFRSNGGGDTYPPSGKNTND